MNMYSSRWVQTQENALAGVTWVRVHLRRANSSRSEVGVASNPPEVTVLWLLSLLTFLLCPLFQTIRRTHHSCSTSEITGGWSGASSCRLGLQRERAVPTQAEWGRGTKGEGGNEDRSEKQAMLPRSRANCCAFTAPPGAKG